MIYMEIHLMIYIGLGLTCLGVGLALGQYAIKKLKGANDDPQKLTVNYPVAFHTVDMAIVRFRGTKPQVAMIKKHHEVNAAFLRFPGGFVDPSDNSAEMSASRETSEELGIDVPANNFVYMGSSNVDDPRYRNSPHKILTSFYFAEVDQSTVISAGDDAAYAEFIDIENLNENNINPIHKPLVELLKQYLLK